MKIVVISDTHGKNSAILDIMSRESDADMLLHCGDICADVSEIIENINCPFHVVSGNMDFGSPYPNEKVVEAEGHRIYLSHGNRQYVKFGLQELMDAAKDVYADIALFGHTHVALLDEKPGLKIMNPGSPVYPRSAERKGTYGIVEISTGGTVLRLKDYQPQT